MKRIVLFCPGNLNFGDNAILFTWLEFFDNFFNRDDEVLILGCETGYIEPYLRKFKYRIYCTDLLHRYVWKNFTDEAIRYASIDDMTLEEVPPGAFMPVSYSLPSFFKTADYVHVLGGGILNSMWVDIQCQVKLVAALCQKYNKKIILTGQTVGPLNKLDEDNLRSVFKSAALCDLRDNTCFDYVKSINDSVLVTVDDVFVHMLLKMNTKKTRNQNICSNIADLINQEHINVCIQKSNAVEESVYMVQLQEIAKYLNRYLLKHSTCKIYMLEFMPLDHDMEVADLLISFLDESMLDRVVKLSLPNYYPFDIEDIIATANFNLGTRFHMALFSLASNIPVVSFSLNDYYSCKFKGLEEIFHCRIALPFDEVTIDKIETVLSGAVNFHVTDNVQMITKKKLKSYYTVTCDKNWTLSRLKYYGFLRKLGAL